MTRVSERYEGKPFLRLLECYVHRRIAAGRCEEARGDDAETAGLNLPLPEAPS